MRSKKIGWDIPKRKNKLTGKLEGNIIYVLGTVDGKFYRKSTGKEATAINIAWIRKNARDVLLKIIDKENTEKESKNSLKEYGYRVLESTSRLRSLNTQKEKLGYFRNHILSYFESRGVENLQDIKTTEVEIWQNQLLKKYSTSTVKKCKDTLGLIMNKAVADDIIVKNYVSLSDNIKMKSKKRTPYTVAEVVLLLKESQGWFKTFLYLVFSTGLRTGEAIGLMWKDIDFENGFIDLNRSITKGRVTTKKGNCTIQEYVKNGYEIVFENNTNTTKNHNRIIPLDNKTKKILYQEFLNRTQEEWIFVNKDNICFADSSSINKYYWKPLLAKTKVEDKNLYTARHTYISIMKNSGADESFLKAIGGWTQSSNVLNNHYFTHENSKEDVAKANNFFYNLKELKVKAE